MQRKIVGKEIITQYSFTSNGVVPQINVKGLMTIPPICDNKHKNSEYFNKMHNLFIDISQKKLDNINMHILSMGMSDDYREAILAGATMVRIGSALFGARNYT